MEVEFLARLQFAVTAAFHFLYPPISIGLGLLLVMLEGMWLKTKDPVWYQATRFWGRVFFLTLRHWCDYWHRNGVRVRHQLVRVLPLRWGCLWQSAGGRGRLRLLPRVGLPGLDVLWLESNSTGLPLLLNHHGCLWRASERLVDSGCQLLDADSCGFSNWLRRLVVRGQRSPTSGQWFLIPLPSTGLATP